MIEKLCIVKVGGQVIEDKEVLGGLLDAFGAIEGRKILVAGGGRLATALSSRLGIESRMVEGRRITDADMLEVVTMVYAGLVSKGIVAGLQARGVNAIGLCGADMDIVRSAKRPVGEIDYGFAGDVRKVDAAALESLLNAGAVPVLCPITHDGNGQLLNTNADTIASSVASALASRYEVSLTFCFEKAGVLLDRDDPSSVISRLDSSDYRRYRESGVIAGGMIPKLDNAFAALEAGVKKVMITDAGSLDRNIGTVIV